MSRTETLQETRGWTPEVQDRVAKIVAMCSPGAEGEASLGALVRVLDTADLTLVDLSELIRNAPAPDEFDLAEHRVLLGQLFSWLLNELRLRGYAITSEEADDMLALDRFTASGKRLSARELAEAFALYSAVRRRVGR